MSGRPTPGRLAATLMLLLGAACAGESTDPIGPTGTSEPALGKGGPRAAAQALYGLSWSR